MSQALVYRREPTRPKSWSLDIVILALVVEVVLTQGLPQLQFNQFELLGMNGISLPARAPKSLV